MIKGEKIALIGVFINTFLGVLKYTLGYISGSLSLKADAYHSFLDILVSLFIFVGLKISQRRIKNFPFGLHKIENLLSLLIGVIMILAGLEIITEAVYSPSIIKGEMVPFTSTVILILAALNYLWASYKIKTGKEILSPSITSDGYHSRIESFTLVLIALGLFGNSFKNLPIDKGVAILISLSIFKVSLAIIWDAIKVLLDGSVEQETYNEIQTILSTHPMVDSVSELLIRRSGKYLFIETTIILKGNINIDLATQIKHELQEIIIHKISNIERITINCIKSAKIVYAVMADDAEGTISHHAARAPFVFLIKDMTEKNMVVIENPTIRLEKQKGVTLVNFLKSHSVDTVVTRKDVQNKGIVTLLQNAGIRHLSLNSQNIHEFMNTRDIPINDATGNSFPSTLH